MSVKKFNIIEQLPVVAAVLVLVLAGGLAGMLGHHGAKEQRRVELAELVLAVLRERHLQPEFSTQECRIKVVKERAARWKQTEEKAVQRMVRLAGWVREGAPEAAASTAMGAWWLGEKGAEELLLARVTAELKEEPAKIDRQQERWQSLCQWMVGLLACRSGDDELAVRELEKLSSAGRGLSTGERRWVALDLARSLDEAERYEDARKSVVQMLEEAAENPVGLPLEEFHLKVWLAKLDRKAGHDERAKAAVKDLLREAERASRRDDWYVEAMMELGRVLIQQGQKNVLVLMQEAMGLRLMHWRPDQPRVLEDQVWLAGALRIAGQREEALSMVNEVIERCRQANSDARYPLPQAWWERSEILRANGDLPGALKAAERGLDSNPKARDKWLQVRLLHSLAKTHLMLSQAKDAQARMTAAAKWVDGSRHGQVPSWIRVSQCCLLGEALEGLGEMAQAEREFERMKKLLMESEHAEEPQGASYLARYGRFLTDKGRVTEAQQVSGTPGKVE